MCLLWKYAFTMFFLPFFVSTCFLSWKLRSSVKTNLEGFCRPVIRCWILYKVRYWKKWSFAFGIEGWHRWMERKTQWQFFSYFTGKKKETLKAYFRYWSGWLVDRICLVRYDFKIFRNAFSKRKLKLIDRHFKSIRYYYMCERTLFADTEYTK